RWIGLEEIGEGWQTAWFHDYPVALLDTRLGQFRCARSDIPIPSFAHKRFSFFRTPSTPADSSTGSNIAAALLRPTETPAA
ncbi:hypothetical protein, partial [Salmonella enterica]|uniref:hypothetical protein n=1 Tax=Salmonella enterica TaxID=28901 RepID=UPI000A8B975D